MSKGFGSKTAATRMRDIVKGLIKDEMSRADSKLGTVASVDRRSNTATVVLNGDTEAIGVVTPGIQPFAGDVVIVKGKPGKFYISDVLSGHGWSRHTWFRRLQDSMSGGGTMTWNAGTGAFVFPVRFLLRGVGDGFTQYGYINIGPCVGGVPVPRFNCASNTPSVTIVNGVSIDQTYNTLYYELPFDLGDPVGFAEDHFRLVGETDQVNQFDVPEHWIMIASRNDDATGGQSLKVFNGKNL